MSNNKNTNSRPLDQDDDGSSANNNENPTNSQNQVNNSNNASRNNNGDHHHHHHHRDPVLNAFGSDDDDDDDDEGEEVQQGYQGEDEEAYEDDFQEDEDEEDDDDFETFTGDGGHVQAQGPALSNVADRLLQARLRQLNTLRRQFMGGGSGGEDEEVEDEDEEDGDEGNATSLSTSAPATGYNAAMRRFFASILGGNNNNNTSSGASARAGATSTSSSGAVGGNTFSSLRNFFSSNQGNVTANSREQPQIQPSLVSGTAFFSSMSSKKQNLLSDPTTSKDVFAPIATSGNFLMRPHPEHVPAQDSYRINTSLAADPEEFTKPEKNFWNEYEDCMDDAVLALVKHELRNDDGSASSSVRAFSSPTTPRHDRNKTVSHHDNNNHHHRHNNQDQATAAATSSISATPTNNQNNNQPSLNATAELDYSPWAGPSPVNRERDEQERLLQQDASANPAVVGGQRLNFLNSLRKTVPSSSSASSQVVSNCVSFLRSAPALLPTIHRGSVNGCHAFQPISGFSLSSSEGVAHDETMLFSMGSRAGQLAVGAFQPSHWKRMILTMKNNNNNHRNGSHVNEDDAANVQNGIQNTNADDDDDDDDDPEFAAMGRNRRRVRNDHPHHTSATTQRLLNFPLQHMETIRRTGDPLFDTAWHPTIPMYASVGGSAEMILGFAGDVLRKVQDQENHPSAGHLNIDDDEDNDAIMSQNILPRVSSTTNNNNNNNNMRTKRAKNLIVDVNNQDAWRSYVYSVDFFGYHSVVCGCSAGSVSTVVVRPDGQFVVRPFAIHADDVNAVARFGRDPESSLFVTGSDDRRVALCDSRVAGGHVAYGAGHTLGIMSLTARRDDFFFASVGKDQVVKLWDVRKLSAPLTEMGLRRGDLAARDRANRDDDRGAAVRWNHYSPPSTAPAPTQTRGCQASLSMPNTKRFVYTLVRAKFSPFASTGGRYLLVGGCGGSQIFDIVSGGVVANLVWDDAGSADEVMRDVAWIDENCVIACTQTGAHVFAGF